jgi:hypothetical protein
MRGKQGNSSPTDCYYLCLIIAQACTEGMIICMNQHVNPQIIETQTHTPFLYANYTGISIKRDTTGGSTCTQHLR